MTNLHFDANIYSELALLKASYDLSKEAFFSIKKDNLEFIVSVEARIPTLDLQKLCNEFKNIVIDHQLRLKIAKETKVIKEAIITAALREAGVE